MKAPKKTIASSAAIVTPAICWSASGARPPGARRVDIERIDRAWDQRHQQAERGREHEGGEEVRGLRSGRVPAVHDRPPDANPRHEVREMLDVEQRVRMAQRRVVDPRQVPGVVRGQPERQRHEGPEEREPGRPLGELAAGPPVRAATGAHSARTTFWSRCAHRNVWFANGSSCVTNAANTRRRRGRRRRGERAGSDCRDRRARARPRAPARARSPPPRDASRYRTRRSAGVAQW